jgi:predicted RNA-binding protein with PUA-like domain
MHVAQRCWLVKSEPDAFSFDDLMAAPGRTTPWDGCATTRRGTSCATTCAWATRCSSTTPTNAPGVVGLAEVASEPYPDPSQFDPSSRYYDAEHEADPRWQLVDIRGRAAARSRGPARRDQGGPRASRGCSGARRGTRLSVMPVDAPHAEAIVALADAPGEET